MSKPKKKINASAPAQKHRCFVFTCNNPNTTDLAWPEDKIRFASWQKEVGGEGTPHLQGYVVFRSPVVYRTVIGLIKQLAGNHPFVEKRKGTHEEALAYSRKEESRVEGPWTFGTPPPGSGSRSDLLSVKKAIDSGSTLEQIASTDEFFPSFCRYHRALEKYILITSKFRTQKTKVLIYYGNTNIGKTRHCETTWPGAYWMFPPNSPNGGLWFDHYVNQPVVVVDEFYGWIPFHHLLRLCDSSPLLVQTKGGTVKFSASTIVFTSNKAPWNWYTGVSDLNRDAFQRRIDGIFTRYSWEEEWQPQTFPSLLNHQSTFDPSMD